RFALRLAHSRESARRRPPIGLACRGTGDPGSTSASGCWNSCATTLRRASDADVSRCSRAGCTTLTIARACWDRDRATCSATRRRTSSRSCGGRGRRNDRRARCVRLGMPNRCRVLLISGSLRSQSTNTAVLRTAQAVAAGGVEAILYDGLAGLPPFNPDDDEEPLPAAVAALRTSIRAADALLFSTPEYAGALPGSFKNLLDWTIGDDHPGSIYEKPVAWINASPRGASHAHESLRVVLGYAHASVVEQACLPVPVTAGDVDEHGLVGDADARATIAAALGALADAIRAGDRTVA